MTTNQTQGIIKVFGNLWQNSSMIVVYIVMFLLCAMFVPYFLTTTNMNGLLLSVTTIGMVAATMLFVLGAGDVDLSVGSTVAFAGVLTAKLLNVTGNVFLSVLGGVLAGALVGLVNGVFIAKFGLNPLITTLATLQIVRGLGLIVSNAVAIGITIPAFFKIGNNVIWGIPVPILLTVVIMAIFGVLLNNTAYGRNVLAIGGNKEAARLSGVNVNWTKIVIFTLQGFVAGFGGVILASRMTSGQPNSSIGFELDVISACVLGGVSLSGGVGTMSGVIVGVLIMGTVQDVLNLWNVPTFYQYLVRGTILLIAILLDQLKQRKKA